MEINKTVHVKVNGTVQGVFYRATAKQKANSLGIKGWVKNTAEGAVEMRLSGNENTLKEMVDWCHAGPPSAVVTNVVVKEIPFAHFSSFTIQR